MSDKGRWDESRRAWERLNGWDQDRPSAAGGHPHDGDGAAEALADIGLVRHLLDQTELVAVRVARRHGKSWAEIATRLGVTRQSAWERWKDLDDEPGATPSGSGSSPERVLAAETDALVDELAGRRTRERRRGSKVVVPNVVGMPWEDARQVLREQSLIGVGSDPDGLALAAVARPGAAVTDQSPESGAKVPAGSTIKLWVERGGGSAGVREPLRPKPSPLTGQEMRPEPSNEAFG